MIEYFSKEQRRREKRKDHDSRVLLVYKMRMVIYVYSQVKFRILIVIVLKSGRLYSPLKLLDKQYAYNYKYMEEVSDVLYESFISKNLQEMMRM